MEDAFLYPTIGIGIGALSVLLVILPFTDVFVAIGKGIGALSVQFAILPFTDVFVAIGKGSGALSVLLPFFHSPTYL